MENATFLYKTALSKANVKTNRIRSTKWTHHKERRSGVFIVNFEHISNASIANFEQVTVQWDLRECFSWGIFCQVNTFFQNFAYCYHYWIQLMECATLQMFQYTKIIEGLESKDFYSRYTIIKVKQYFISVEKLNLTLRQVDRWVKTLASI